MEHIKTLQDQFEVAFGKIISKVESSDDGSTNAEATEIAQELARSQEALQAVEAKNAQQRAEFQTLSEEYGNMELALNAATGEQQSSNDQKAASQERIEKLQENLTSTRDQLDRQKERNISLQEQVAAAKERNSALKEQIATLNNNDQSDALNKLLSESRAQRSADIKDVESILQKLKPLVEE
ncbi:hypothetical protein GCM10007939_03560 [Amylibacter marinus]|uniref:Uncharacterized protein n=1 Tax=Amylibacter marinus TaxID=1475483 RepID=A0ABQ5VRN1_9RHOB|nr:hypothetical protein [Amylibacter marinus]GLQ34073.1 hypothetical protein GCM10007939_03560 [Amylibacter marinus]